MDMKRRVTVEIDLGALVRNYRRIAAHVRPARVLCVLKANAYGLGVADYARALAKAGCTMFGVAECMRSKKCMDYLSCGNYAALGDMMKTSHDGDRLVDDHLSDRRLEELAALEFDVSRIGGGYNCSTERIDALCDLLNATPGVLGSQIVGADQCHEGKNSESFVHVVL